MLLVVRWFPGKYYVILTGFIVFIECLGAIFGESAIIYLTKFFTINEVILVLAGFGLLLIILFSLIVKDHPETDYQQPNKKTNINLRFLLEIISDKQIWLIAICAMLLWAPIAVFASLWGVSFVHVAYHVSSLLASDMLIMIWLGIGLAGPLIGYYSNVVFKRKLPIQVFAFIGLISSTLIISRASNSTIFMLIMLFCLGAASAAQVITFGMIRDKFADKHAATAFGFNNMLICFGNAIFQVIVGFLIDLKWGGVLENNVRVYPLTDYQFALAVMPMCFLAVIVITTFLIRETYPATEEIEFKFSEI